MLMEALEVHELCLYVGWEENSKADVWNALQFTMDEAV